MGKSKGQKRNAQEVSTSTADSANPRKRLVVRYEIYEATVTIQWEVLPSERKRKMYMEMCIEWETAV